ncbi:hypothetical protein J8L88_18920 [Aquimarina sp. MMG015]|uniref:hypothetical protein n=1 Tax=Aquimarina TaxID=290174 RepID=UPI0004221B87|nr:MULTISPECIES: hypothetical protein [Aquimarina]AXT58228.1 hypothetical protein D1815_21585 [Aquimarina sp. AD1]MBQ4804945.1 hypothetical protein [Aquimarina sp. MMG015]RKN16955.1 hypothetical protein D7035_15075 [Aquimarina sp. AD1]
MKERVQKNASSNTVYGLGIIGALIYYVSQATSFWVGIIGVLKAFVWPAFLVYELLSYVNAS